MIKIKKVLHELSESPTPQGNYVLTLTLIYHNDAESLASVRAYTKEKYPAQYPGDDFSFEGKALRFDVKESTAEKLLDIVRSFKEDSALPLMYSQSEFESVKELMDMRIKYLDCSSVEA